MSSKSIGKKIQETLDQEIELEEPLNFNKIIIPFSKFYKPTDYIYYGHEKIPFKKRHPIYQAILRNEFIDSLQEL
ncbi:MAG: hypothetical protein ACFFBV_04390 [Promethearchaeota archaeon]